MGCLTRAGYVCEEWKLSGRAEVYTMTGRPRPDGRWPVRPAGEADHCTRPVVVRPRDAAVASGTVLLEWMNASGGVDVPTDWHHTHRHRSARVRSISA